MKSCNSCVYASSELEQEDKENVCPVEDIQAADAKPKEPVDAEAKRELQAKRLSSPLKELSLERALEGSEEPVEADIAPLPTTEETKEVRPLDHGNNCSHKYQNFVFTCISKLYERIVGEVMG